jgi:hypothetical protein
MPLPISCPNCGARLRVPDSAIGRTLHCPKCNGPVVVPSTAGPASEFAFAPSQSGRDYPDEEGNPFDDDGPPPLEEPAGRKKTRKTTAKRKPAGFNPFDNGGTEGTPTTEPTKKRRYRKDGDYNPFSDTEADEEPDPAAEGFDFGAEAPPSAPKGEFDFGPLDPRRDDRRQG